MPRTASGREQTTAPAGTRVPTGAVVALDPYGAGTSVPSLPAQNSPRAIWL
jgi:hypothetical protein